MIKLFLFSLFCVFLMPTTTQAILMVDENGNPIKSEIKDGEVIIMTTPEDSVSSDGGNVGSTGSKSSDEMVKEGEDVGSSVPGSPGQTEPYMPDRIEVDGVVSNDEQAKDIIDIKAPATDDVYTETSDMERAVVAQEDEKGKTGIIFITLGSILGVIGTLIVLLIRK